MSNNEQSVPDETDVLILGAGPGGYVAAIRAGQLGMDVALIEKDAYGGTCLNYGCIPSKALLSATDVAHQASTADQLGVYGDPEIDIAAMNEWKDGVVSQLTGGVENLCRQSGATLLDGRAEFIDDTTARVVHEEASAPVDFESAIIATGSRAIEIPGFDFQTDYILNSRQALGLDAVPESLLVVGAGYIGMELSSVYAKAGADVTVIEMLEDVLPGYEDDIAAIVRERLEAMGIEFHFGEQATDWEEQAGDGDGIVVTAETADGEQTEYEATKTLVAVGREPVTDTINMEAIGLEPNEDGFIETDDRAQTEINHIFAVGDVAGEPLLAHKGMMEGEIAAECIAGEPAALDYQAIPAVVFTDPEVATVGLTEAAARDAGYSTTVGEMPMQASGRALTLNDTDGFVRVVADAEMGYLLGAQIVAPEASELIGELGLAIELGATLEDVAKTIHMHPTLSEAVKEAAANARGRAIHRRNR